MSLYEVSVQPMKRTLSSVDRWLEKAVAYAQQKSFEPNVFVTARLAPDQFSLARQLQAACDQAKACASRLAGKEPPKHPDTETTIEELRARIRTVIKHLDSFTEADFAGAETRLIELPFLEGKLMLGKDFLNEMALPNFYFHVTHVYAILRHNGVELGKRDFISSLTLRDR
jgi:hypothetical protein